MKHGLVDWDCPEAISIPDMERALAHIRSTGTFPVSILSSPTLSCRRDHGAASFDPESDETPSLFPALCELLLLACSSTCSAIGFGFGSGSSAFGSSGAAPLSPPSSPPRRRPPPPPPPPLTHPSHPAPQSFLESKEDQNSVGAPPITTSQIDAARARVLAWLQPGQPGSRIFPHPELSPAANPPRLCLVDGFLLYAVPEFVTVMTAIDIKLFLLVSRAKATRRREARDGYVTLEGFWQDPPGYMDTIVWPNYASAHAWMFENRDAEAGRLNGEALTREGICAQLDRGVDVDFGETLEWAVDTIMKELEAIVLGDS